MILALLLGGVYVPFPWICNYGGSDVIWLLGLGHQRWQSLCLGLLGCLLLETMLWGNPKWPTWKDCMERPDTVFQWTAPVRPQSTAISGYGSKDISRWFQVLPTPRVIQTLTSHPHCGLCKFLILKILEHNDCFIPLSFRSIYNVAIVTRTTMHPFIKKQLTEFLMS